MMLNSGDLIFMRDTQKNVSFPDTCVIEYRDLSGDGGYGGQSVTWTERATGVSCRLAPRSVEVGIDADREEQLGTHILTIPYDQAIDYDDRIRVNGASADDAYYVVGIEQLNSTWRTARRAGLSRTERT